jgi:hypothetical protein
VLIEHVGPVARAADLPLYLTSSPPTELVINRQIKEIGLPNIAHSSIGDEQNEANEESPYPT